MRNWRSSDIDAQTRALCEYAEKLTKEPFAVGEDEIIQLKEIGFSERAIHDAVQIIAYFNYINRIADALGVEPESFIRKWG